MRRTRWALARCHECGWVLQVKDQLEQWVKADPIFKVVGAPIVELSPRPKTLLAELRRLVVMRQALDGVRIDHAGFDEENVFVIGPAGSRRSSRSGPLIGKAAAIAWKELRPPTKAATFALCPDRIPARDPGGARAAEGPRSRRRASG